MAANDSPCVVMTGASGFVGAHVARLALAAGRRVSILALPGDPLSRLSGVLSDIQIVRGDLASPDTYKDEIADVHPHVCIHLAWYAEPGKYLDARENLDSLVGSLRLIEVLQEAGCGHLVGIGTCAEYETSKGLVSETSPTGPVTLYAAAKLSMYLMGRILAAQGGMTFAWARLFHLFGPGEDPRRLVPSLIRALRRGDEFPATDGNQVRDYLHVEDVANAIWRLADQRHEGIYNVCSRIPITVRHLLTTAAGILGSADKIRFGQVPYRKWEPDFICGDNTRLLGTGWSARYGLQDGLEHTVNWWACQTAG